ncbi:MAG: hypothetical protein OXU63_01290 [Acidobacteriota bacterium]|nr:hypothetical protein [Acidobacteriota bacterium]
MTKRPLTDGDALRNLLTGIVNGQCETFSFLVRAATSLGLTVPYRKQLGYEMRGRRHRLIEESVGPPTRIGHVDLESAGVDREALRDLLAGFVDVEAHNLDLLVAVGAEAGVKTPHDPEDLQVLVANRRRLLDRALR